MSKEGISILWTGDNYEEMMEFIEKASELGAEFEMSLQSHLTLNQGYPVKDQIQHIHDLGIDAFNVVVEYLAYDGNQLVLPGSVIVVMPPVDPDEEIRVAFLSEGMVRDIGELPTGERWQGIFEVAKKALG